MNHLEALIMNEVSKALEGLQGMGVGYIDQEVSNKFFYKIDDRLFTAEIREVKKND